MVSIIQFLEIVLSYFDGDKGIQFQNACATYCCDQNDAIEFLTKRALGKDVFSKFLKVC